MDKTVLKLTALGLGMICMQPSHASIYQNWAPAEQEVFNLVNLQRSLNGQSTLAADSRLHDAATAHSADMSVNNFFSHTGTGNTDGGERITDAGYKWNGWGENIAAGYGTSFVGSTATLTSADNAARLVMYGTADINEISSFSTSKGGIAFNDWSQVGQGWGNTLWDSWQAQKNGNGGWMGSAGHRSNILTDFYTDLGVGLVFDSADQAIPGASNPYYSYWTQDFASGDTSPVPLPPALLLFVSAFSIFGFANRKQKVLA